MAILYIRDEHDNLVPIPAIKGEKGDPGERGDPGKDGSDANVTEESIVAALGFTPVSDSRVLTDVPANAKFTDTIIPVIDNLTSTSATSALSAKQGKVLKDLIDNNAGQFTDLGYFEFYEMFDYIVTEQLDTGVYHATMDGTPLIISLRRDSSYYYMSMLSPDSTGYVEFARDGSNVEIWDDLRFHELLKSMYDLNTDVKGYIDTGDADAKSYTDAMGLALADQVIVLTEAEFETITPNPAKIYILY